jgi:hypothetical protein
LIDKADENDSKIEMLSFKLADKKDSQTRMQAEIVKINESLKNPENIPVQKSQEIE